MNITIHLTSWVVPEFITLLGFAATLIMAYIMAYMERKDTGWFAGMFTALVMIICFVGTAIAWIVWGLTMWLK